MNLIYINDAEAIIEPFYDGGTGDHSDYDKRYRVLDEYTATQHANAKVTLTQAWAFAEFCAHVLPDNNTDDTVALTMERSCNLQISGFDTFMVFAAVPQSMYFSLSAKIDGKWTNLFNKVKGKGVSYEFETPFEGEQLTGIKMDFYVTAEGEKGTLCWFGLANCKRRAAVLNRKSYYDKTWPGYFEQKANTMPQLAILFDAQELKELQKKLFCAPFDKVYAKKRHEAKQNMQIVPEEYIGRYVPDFDRRWNRTRDEFTMPVDIKGAGSKSMSAIVEDMAFVGIIEQDVEMMKMAVRHAISICHCEYWSESLMGNLPGATWHHRSFTEQNYCRVIALVLDWCGGLLTPFGKQTLRDALVMKGLPRIESDFKRVEYIRHMNQGIVFCSGRIFALLALKPRYPRYGALLTEAEADMTSMIDNYIQPDGGTLEGPGYWMFTFGEAVAAFYALAKSKNVPFVHYRDVFSKTGEFALASLSLQGDATTMIPINDAHPGARISCALAASFAAFTANTAWDNLYKKLIDAGQIDKDNFALISAPLPKQAQKADDICTVYPVTGQLGSVRKGNNMTTRVHLCTGPTYVAHYNEDKGSVIIEAESSTLCPDCGSPYYYESDLFWLGSAHAHSLLYPVKEDGTLSIQGRYNEGGVAVKALVEQGGVDFVSDDTNAWQDSVYKKVVRRVLSPFAELIIIEDDYELGTAHSVRFALNSYGEWRLNKTGAVANIDGIDVKVTALNWRCENAEVFELQDGEHRKVWQLRLACSKNSALLQTAITLEKSMRFSRKETADGFEFVCGSDKAYIERKD